MKIIDFITNFPDESSCKSKWKGYRDKQGVLCSRCGGTDHYWKKDKENYECKNCRYRQSLRANTVMHGSQLPFRYWFIAIHLLTSTKKSFSAKVIPKKDVSTLLPWAHIAISNAKRMLLNTFHAMKPEYLQNYLNEFCYMFNRRYFGERLFDRLMVAAVCYKNKFRCNIR